MADKPSKTNKRRVKNPETFRERAIKAADEGDKPTKASKIKGVGGKVVSPVTRPVGKVGGTLFRLKPVRFIGKVVFPVYFRNSVKELRLVKWPSWLESRRLTFAVLLFAVIFGVSIAIVDYGLDKVFRHVLLK